MMTGHEGAPGGCRTPDARDSEAAALRRTTPVGPSENSSELAGSVRRWVTESARAAHGEPLAGRAAAATRGAPSGSGVRDPLPRRRTITPTREQRRASSEAGSSRVALLIDPAGLDQDALAEVLCAVHATYDRPALSRAYADWTRPEARKHLEILGDHAVQPVHSFESGAGHTLVALTVDALQAVGTYGVTCVIVVADLEAVLPLLTHLRASGTRVVTVGPASTPAGLRSQADEFIAIPALDHLSAHPVEGRHRRDARRP